MLCVFSTGKILLIKGYTYDITDDKINGISVAQKLLQPIDRVFKTLVTKSGSGELLVFIIPVANELDLKAAARAAHVKSVELIPVAAINMVTGYIRGGCSPVGMKKALRTFLDNSCEALETIIVSAGKRSIQVELSPVSLLKLLNGTAAALSKGI